MRAIFLLAALMAASAACADTHRSQHHEFRTVTVVEGLEHPWAVAFLPDGDMLVTERPGRLRHIRNGALVERPVAGLPDIHAERQGGLLDVVLHPDFAQNRFVYLTYAKRCASGGNTTALGRGQWRDGALAGFEEIFEADACAPGGRHHGSRLVFDRDGYLFMTVGDRGVQDRAQEPRDNVGVTLRLNDDGTIPDDNPFVGDDRGHDANYTYGNRNAQGIAMHPRTGEIWQHEHGPRGGDELNITRRGANYGWPAATLGIEYDGSVISRRTHEEVGAVAPVHEWTPSIAASGMAFYTGDAFPEWRGDLFVGALALQHVARLRLDGERVVEEERLLHRAVGRIRDVRVGPDGLIYVLTDDRRGKLLRLEPVQRAAR